MPILVVKRGNVEGPICFDANLRECEDGNLYSMEYVKPHDAIILDLPGGAKLIFTSAEALELIESLEDWLDQRRTTSDPRKFGSEIKKIFNDAKFNGNF